MATINQLENLPVGTQITAEYLIGVYKPGVPGYRSEIVFATLEIISGHMARVISADMEPATSNRQRYNTVQCSKFEIGKRKRFTSLFHMKTLDGVEIY